MLQRSLYLAGQGIGLHNPVDLIPEKLNADQIISSLCRKHFQHISPYAEAASFQIHIITVILHFYQSPYDIISIPLHARSERHTHPGILFRTSQTINTGDTGHHNHVPPFCK